MTTVNCKYIVWQRLTFNCEASEVIKKIEEGIGPTELCDEDELNYQECQVLFETEKFIEPKKGEVTLEVIYYDKKGNEKIWTNLPKSKKLNKK